MDKETEHSKETLPPPIEEVVVKCEIIEESDEELRLYQPTEYQKEQIVPVAVAPEVSLPKPKEKRTKLRVRKKGNPSEFFQCEVCAKAFPSKWQLAKHSRVHTGERPYVCIECGKGYKHSHSLKAHEMTHTGLIKKFTCPTCGSAFTRKSTLCTHEKIHTGEKPYKCNICEKSFVQKINLVYHIKMHEDDRQFKCEVCKKMFITRSKLRQHYKKHLNDFIGHPDLDREEISNDSTCASGSDVGKEESILS